MHARSRPLAVLVAVAGFAAFGFSVVMVGPVTAPGPPEVAGGEQRTPLLVATPGPIVAFWTDSRNLDRHVYASRLDPTTLAAVDGPGGLDIGFTYGRAHGVAAAWGGQSFTPGGYVLSVRQAGPVRGRRFLLDGGQSSELQLSGNVQADELALASDGDGFLLVYVDYGLGTPRVFALPLTPSGAPGAAAVPLPISEPTRRSVSPRVAWTGGRWVLVWMDGQSGSTNIVARELSPASMLGPPRQLSTAVPAELPDVVGLPDGGTFAAWFESVGAGRRLVGTVIEAQQPATLLVTDAGAKPWYGIAEGRPALALRGPQVVLAWSGAELPSFSDRVTFGLMAEPYSSIALMSHRPLAIASAPSLAANPAGAVYAAYTDHSNAFWDWDDDSADVTGEQLDGVLGTLTRATFPVSYVEQRAPAIASDGVSTLAAWVEYHRDGGYDVHAGRLGAAGSTTPHPVGTGPGVQLAPSLAASDAGVFLVAWTDLELREVRAQRLKTDAVALGPPLTVGMGPGLIPDYPCVAFGEGVFLVVWTDGVDVDFRRYDVAGAALDPAPRVLCSGCVGNGRPFYDRTACAFGGGAFGVAWLDARLAAEQVAYGRVFPDGGVPMARGQLVTATSVLPAHVALAWDGAQFVLVWHDHKPSLSLGELWGARLRGETVVDFDGVRLVAARPFGEQYLPALAAVPGGGLLLAWEDEHDGAVSAVHLVDGAIVGPTVMLAGPNNFEGVAATAAGDRTVVAVSRNGEAGSSNALRLHTVEVKRGGTGDSCAFGFDCRSGLCANGLCSGAGGGAGGAGGGAAGGAGGGAAGGGDAGTGGGVAGDGGGAAAGAGGGAGPALSLGVGCGCASSPGALGFLVLLALFRAGRVRWRAP